VTFTNHFLRCSSGRRLKVRVPALGTALPEVESADELNEMPDPPRIEFEIILDDDGGDAYPTVEEMLEGARYLEERGIIPEALAEELRKVIVATAE
jgi:hypothetical protein